MSIRAPQPTSMVLAFALFSLLLVGCGDKEIQVNGSAVPPSPSEGNAPIEKPAPSENVDPIPDGDLELPVPADLPAETDMATACFSGVDLVPFRVGKDIFVFVPQDGVRTVYRVAKTPTDPAHWEPVIPSPCLNVVSGR